METARNPLVIISSDGHAGARMADYRPYLDAPFRDEFDLFLPEWDKHGSRNFDAPALRHRVDSDVVDDWSSQMVETGRLDGFFDPEARLREVEKEGIVAEVLFPDFGLPFDLYSPGLASALGYPPLDEEHRKAGYRAFNRWLSDYISAAPERFAGMAIVSWDNVDEAVSEIRRARDSGLRGIVLPAFAPEMPLFHEQFEPIWNTVEELEMIVNTHSGLSSTSNRPIFTPGVPHSACNIRVHLPEFLFNCHNILSHLIWGGVCERHPNLKFVFTEQGSGWVVAALTSMDWTYEGSYFRSDFKTVIRSRPREYFDRQVFMGSSLFSLPEVEDRFEIGIDKMMLGMDFPHQEGTWFGGTREYLQATLGAANVPTSEARKLLAENASTVFGFDLERLLPIAERIGVLPEHVLAPPIEDLFPRGDVHRPVSSVF